MRRSKLDPTAKPFSFAEGAPAPAPDAPAAKEREKKVAKGKSATAAVKVCKFWQLGVCKKGAACKFSHEGEPGAAQKTEPKLKPVDASQSGSSSDQPQTWPCPFCQVSNDWLWLLKRFIHRNSFFEGDVCRRHHGTTS